MIGWIILSKLILSTVSFLVGELLLVFRVKQVAVVGWIGVFFILLTPPLVIVPLLESRSERASDTELDVGDQQQANAIPRIPSGAVDFHQATPSGSPENQLAGYQPLPTSAFSRLIVFLSGIWVSGFLFLVIQSYRAFRRLTCLVQFAKPCSPVMKIAYDKLTNSMKVANPPKVVEANGVFTPFLWHPVFGNAFIVLPTLLLARLTENEQLKILQHELVHFQRNDAWRRRLERLVCSIWWWHPVSWSARCRLIDWEEQKVDAALTAGSPLNARAYAKVLLTTEEFVFQGADVTTELVPALIQQRSLQVRIESIVNGEVNEMRINYPCFVAGFVFALLPLGFVSLGYSHSATGEQSPAVSSDPSLAKGDDARQDRQEKQSQRNENSTRKRASRIQDDVSDANQSYEGSPKYQDAAQITLYRRNQNEYGQSAYSFRYRTQEKSQHRNYVDLVYSTDGKLRINNHGGMQARIAKLGPDASLTPNENQLKQAKWTNENLTPESGTVYALEIKALDERQQVKQMTVVFKVGQVGSEKLDFVWSPSEQNPWPIDNRRFGMAGTSGMRVYRRSGR